MSFSRADTVALMFCCTHKSLTLGEYLYPGLSLSYIGLDKHNF